MKTKRIICAILLIAILAVTFISCSDSDKTEVENNAAKESDTSETPTEKPTVKPTEPPKVDDSESEGNDKPDNNETNDENKGDEMNNNDNQNNENNSQLLDSILESKIDLHFNEDGNFKTLILSDLHVYADGIDQSMKNSMKTLIDRENPDLIIFDGDTISGEAINNDSIFKSVISGVVEYIEEKQIPWMHVFGNHDAEHGYTKEQQQAVYETFDFCISKEGDPSLYGCGNYVIPVYAHGSDDVKFAIWGLDSGSIISREEKEQLLPTTSDYGSNSYLEYDFIHYDQIDWYIQTSKLLQKNNGGKVVPGIMAFHIPLQETYDAWLNRYKLEWTGECREEIWASAFNSGLYAALYWRQDIKAVINGHDHINDFAVNYGGIKLCYTPSFSTKAYSAQDMWGGRVVVVNESDPSNVETYMSYVTEREETSGGVHESKPTPDKNSDGYITNFVNDVNLKHYLTFDDNVTDACGGNTQANGNLVYDEGYFGNAAVLDDGYVSIKDYYPGTDSFSVSFWMRSTGVSGDPSLFSNKDWNDGSANGYVFVMRDGNIYFNVGGDGNRTDISTDLPSNYRENWFHVICVVDRESNEIRISFNFGDFITLNIDPENKNTNFNSYNVLNIGQDGTGNYSCRLSATMDEFMLFDGILTQDNVKALKQYYDFTN